MKLETLQTTDNSLSTFYQQMTTVTPKDISTPTNTFGDEGSDQVASK